MSFTPYDPNAQTNDGGNFEPPADGKHKGVTLTDTWAGTSNSGNDGVILEFVNADGYKWTVWQGFKSEGQSAVTWSQIGKLGIDVISIGSLDELADALKPHVGTYYDVTVKTSENGRFRNTMVDGLSTGDNPVPQQQYAATSAPSTGAAGGGAAVPDDDDIPF